MLSRLISAVIMAAGIAAVLVYGPPWALGLVVLVATFIIALELLGMLDPQADGIDKVVMLTAAVAVVVWPVAQRYAPLFDQGRALLFGFFLLTIARLARPLPIEAVGKRLGGQALALLYIAATVPYIFELRLLNAPHGGWVVLMVMAITFGGDIGGYFAGRFLGKHKLYPAVSPKKTIEGAVGGLALGVAAVLMAKFTFPGLDGLSYVDCAVLGVGGVAFGITGDLVESLIKRTCGVKDAGNLIPGHGGLLDRIDALLFTGPFCVFYLEAVHPW